MGIFDFFNKKQGNRVSSNNITPTKGVLPQSEPVIKPRPRRMPITPNWEKEYERNLRKAYIYAGKQLEDYFKRNNINVKWIQNGLLPPPYFQHICFSYGRNIYSVIIEIEDAIYSYVLDRDIRNQLRECKENDLIPCTMVIRIDTFKAAIDGNHLIYTDKRTPVEMIVRQGEVPMSAWEINNFGISIVIQDLRKEGRKIINYCDLLNVEPQIWFEDENGKRCYVIVKTISGSSKENLKYQINHELVMKLIDFDGYFAQVELVSADPVAYSNDSSIIPLSERFNMEKTKEILYREHGFYVNYLGLEYIERHAEKNGVREEKIYPLGASVISTNTINENRPNDTAIQIDFDKAANKHIITTLLLDYDTCFWTVKDENDKVRFFWKDGKTYLMKEFDFAISVLAWIMLTRKNLHDFLILLEVLKNDYMDNKWIEASSMPNSILVGEITKSFPNFSLSNDPHEVRTQLEWSYIDIKNLNRFMDEASRFIMQHDSEPSGCTASSISECATVFDLYCMVFRYYVTIKK